MFDRIRRRLTLSYVGILAVILVVFSVVVLIAFRTLTSAGRDSMLVMEAEKEARLVAAASAGARTDDAMTDTSEYGFVVVGADARVLRQDRTAPSWGLPDLAARRRALREGETVLTTIDTPGGSVRVASVPVDGGPTVIQYGQSLQMERAAINRLLVILVPVGAVALALAAIGGLYLSRRALRPARDAFDRQRAFVADASHELKTPLALIRADAEVCLRDETTPDQRDLMEDVLLETDRMSHVITDLLLLARLDAGAVALRREPFDLAAVLGETVARFDAGARRKGIRLQVDPHTPLPAEGDRERSAQVLAALVDNAVKFTPAGGAVAVSGTALDGTVEVTVDDTGPGIDPSHLPRIFDRFFRAETSRTRSDGDTSTGLGLSIARELVRAQGGDLTAARALHGGARLTLVLPRATAPLANQSRPDRAIPAR